MVRTSHHLHLHSLSNPYRTTRSSPGAWIYDNTTCPPNYPEGAPMYICGHIAFVELDAKMAYKEAMAYAATGDERHAQLAMDIIQAWATKNKVFGLKNKNGPLEAAW
jgi:hypothetical protein